MAQSATTVTSYSPTPPTNYSCTGARPPNPPNYTRQTMANPVTNAPPYFDDGIEASVGAGMAAELTKPRSLNEAVTPGVKTTFAANTSALASGTTAADNNTGTTPGTNNAGAGGTGFNSIYGTYPGTTNGAVPASASAAHEGAGAEAVITAPGSRAECPTQSVSLFAGYGAFTGVDNPPNQTHASSLTPKIVAGSIPTLTSLSAGGTSGAGNATCTATGTNFTASSVLWINGVSYATTFTNATTISCSAPKKATAGSLPVVVITGAYSTAIVNWVFT